MANIKSEASAGRGGQRMVQVSNAEIDVFGTGWTCKGGYKFASGACVQMSTDELRSYEREMAAALARVRANADKYLGDSERITGDRAEVVVRKSACGDYFVADGPNGYYLLEWYGGYSPDKGDLIVGPINSYGFKDVYYPGHGGGRVWVDD